MKDREIFERFLQQEASIRESWKIVELFEEERAKWSKEALLLEEQRKKLTGALEESKANLKELQEEILHKERMLKEREERLASCDMELKERIKSINEGALLEPSEMKLNSIEVVGKTGEIIKAKPAKGYFSEGYVATLLQELEELKGNKGLREKVLDLELENSKLKLELRDLIGEKTQSDGVCALDSKAGICESGNETSC